MRGRGLSGLIGSVEGSKTKVSFSTLWHDYIVKNIKRNTSNFPAKRAYNFYYNGNATMSGKDLVSFYYTIDGYPSKIPINFPSAIRMEALRGVRVSFVSSFEPTKIDWNSPQMESKLRVWKSVDSEAGDVDEYNYMEHIGAMDNIARRKDSLVYLADADIRRRRSLFRYRTFMIVSGTRGENFDKSIEKILTYCKNIGLSITRVEEKMTSFLRAFSPFSMELKGDIISAVGSNTIPDEQIARFSSYTQGKIGRKGIMFGTDIYSGYSVYKQFKKNATDAETVLITAETGGGKSFMLKFLIAQILSSKYYNGTINDIEGFEYIPFGAFVANSSKVVVFNMAEGQGCYYDPFEISLTGNKSLDEEMFQISKSFTTSYMSVLIGQELLDKNIWAKDIIEYAIAKSYTKLGVNELDSTTWENTLNSGGLFFVYDTFKDLYQEYFDLQESKEKREKLDLCERYKLNPEYLDALDKVVSKLSKYFEPLEKGGIRGNVFRHKVTLLEIINAKLVINSFGMAGKSADTIDKVQMALSQLSAANISYLRSIYSKAQGKFNFKVWEEFQRWGSFPGSETTIKTAVTGGRKLGDVNFIITNDIKGLLDNDSFAILDNVSSFAIGSIASTETRERLCKQLSVPLLKGELDLLATKKGSSESANGEVEVASIYDKSFLVHLDRSSTTIVKVMLPSYIESSDIFKSGVDIDK